MADTRGWSAVTRDAVATEAGTARATVSYAYGDIPQLRNAVVELAVERKKWRVVGQAFAAGNGRAKRLDEPQKRAALAALG